MSTLSLSVIVPTYQRPEELRRALDSIESQTRAPDETVVEVDLVGAGASTTRNRGAARSTGQVLAFLDDDDTWKQSYLERAMALLERHELDVVCTDLLLHQAGREPRPGKMAPDALRPADFLCRNPGVGGSNTLVRREVFVNTGGFDETLPTLNDMDWGLRLALLEPRYRPLHRPLVVYNDHAGPRLSVPGSPGRQKGVLRFYELHGHRMTPHQREAFRVRMVREGMDPESMRCSPESRLPVESS